MAYTKDQALDTHKDYKENINQWEYYIRSYNGGYDYTLGQYLNRYNYIYIKKMGPSYFFRLKEKL